MNEAPATPLLPTSEQILQGEPIPVLDHGYLRYVAHLGDDLTPLEAARMSTGNPTGVDPAKDAATRDFLWRHAHATPFEMAVLQIEVQVPIFVAREWHRHRTQCLSGATEIFFDRPDRLRKGQFCAYRITIGDLFKKWSDPAQRPRIKQMMLRQLNEDTKAVAHTKIVDVIASGQKPTFKVTLADGKSITCSADHKFLFEDGWKTLKEATGLHETNGRAVYRQGEHRLYANGVTLPHAEETYQNANWLRALYHEAGWTLEQIAAEAGVSSHTIRKWLKIHGLQRPHRFSPGHEPWNKDKTYIGGGQSEKQKAAARAARSGARSNFWKGGVSSERANIARWTKEQAPKVHEKHGYTCQLCHEVGGALEAHHVIPVWADESLARVFENLVTLCEGCHQSIHGKELDYAHLFTGEPIKTIYQKKPSFGAPGVTRTLGKLVAIVAIEYVGVEECYDLSVQGPYHNFVANGIVTHNSFNEFSGRYAEMPALYYTPSAERVQGQSTTNKQASGDALDDTAKQAFLASIAEDQALVREHYEGYLEAGVARELARINLPLSQYTRFRAQANLRNWLHFLNLRMAPNAQYEIRVYAQEVARLIQMLWPQTWEVFAEHTLEAATLSKSERNLLLEVLSDALGAGDGAALAAELSARIGDRLSVSRKRELLAKLGL